MLLSDRIFPLSYFNVRRGEIKIEVIEKYISTVLQFFDYKITLSCGDFEKLCTP